MFVINRDTSSNYEIDEQASLLDMERACPRFFKTKHGNRETHSVYRGCLIVRNTVNFTAGPKRTTTVYLFTVLDGTKHLFCSSAGSDINSIRQARRHIDKILDGGIYYYGV